MKHKKLFPIISFLLIAIMVAAPAIVAQDFGGGFDDGLGDEFGGGFDGGFGDEIDGGFDGGFGDEIDGGFDGGFGDEIDGGFDGGFGDEIDGGYDGGSGNEVDGGYDGGNGDEISGGLDDGKSDVDLPDSDLDEPETDVTDGGDDLDDLGGNDGGDDFDPGDLDDDFDDDFDEPPVGDMPDNWPAHWNPLYDVSIKQGTADGTVIYADLAGQCEDLDDAEVVSLTSSHANYNLYFSGKDLLIKNLNPSYIGTERVALDCNGIATSFSLQVVEVPGQQPTGEPAVWKRLTDKHIRQASPDGTVVYTDLALQCTDVDSPVVMKVTSTHDDFDLAFDGTDLAIYNLDSKFTGKEIIRLDCNGISNSFRLYVIQTGGSDDTPPDIEPRGNDLSIHMSSIRIPNEFELSAGELVPIYLHMRNNGDEDLEDIQIAVSIRELGIRAAAGPFDLDNGDSVTKKLFVELPQDVEPGPHYVRVTVSTSSIHRVVHREIEIV